ncbi:hypothetical protein Ccrd_012298 [Cynara cardunculus var. scolymus]|uniref:Uncharacterized protein n=1 Tax=Cynara cardunculus var. scolymus TaxID=59895 RepID=A0A118K5M1_CYNCS|nr:hypothetical protein Ccrd_012298 [Cynara cardunculus var. scolymus]
MGSSDMRYQQENNRAWKKKLTGFYLSAYGGERMLQHTSRWSGDTDRQRLEFRSASGFLIVFYFGRGASGIGCDPGGIIYRDIILEYVDYVVPIYEVDMNYLNVGVAEPDYQIFICNLTLCRVYDSKEGLRPISNNVGSEVLPVNRLVTEKKAIMVTDEEEENDRTEGCWRFLQPTEKNRASLGEIERARNDD